MGVCAVHRLRQAVLGDKKWRVKVTEPYQMLGEIDDPLRKALGLDVVGVHPRKDMFGLTHDQWKPFIMPVDGTEVLVPEDFNYTVDDNGALLMYPQGDSSIGASAKMPKDSFFWDSIRRQEPIDDEKLNYLDNCEEFGELSDADVAHFVREVKHYYNTTDYGIYMTLPGLAFGDTALVPTPWAKRPKGIRLFSRREDVYWLRCLTIRSSAACFNIFSNFRGTSGRALWRRFCLGYWCPARRAWRVLRR